MNEITKLIERSNYQTYMEGAEDGFWRGYIEGAEACRRYICGETTVNPTAPEDFQPLGSRWFDINFADE